MMSIDRIHLVYPHGDRVSAPDSIGRELGKRLALDREVIFHDWDDFEAIPPSPHAALVGHAHPVPFTTFRRSARAGGWGRRVLMEPFVTDLAQVGFLASVLPHVDHFLAITGSHWERVLPSSPFAPVGRAFSRVDLAVSAEDFPVIIREGRPPGERRFVYIGRDVRVKHLDYLEEIARRRPSWTFAWIGPPGTGRPGLQQLGPMDFRSEEVLRTLSSFDVLVTVGRADANPTTVIEAMAWGLLPVCTPQSGYEGYEGIVNLPLDDCDAAVRVLDEVQAMPSTEIAAWRAANRRRVEEQFTWDRFTDVVRSVIDTPGPPPGPMPAPIRWGLTARWWATALAPSNRAGLSGSGRRLWARLSAGTADG